LEKLFGPVLDAMRPIVLLVQGVAIAAKIRRRHVLFVVARILVRLIRLAPDTRVGNCCSNAEPNYERDAEDDDSGIN
jgi:hypothetical protein